MFCWECMDGYITNKLDALEIREDELICMDPKCKQAITPHQLKAAVEEKVYKRLVQLRTQYLEGIRACPSTKGCENQFFVDEKQDWVQCECGWKFCPKCFEEPHSGKTCEEFKKSEEQRKKLNDEAAKADEKELSNYKRCPWCTALVQKISGCECMTCYIPSCRKKFCYICLKKLERGGTGDGISKGMQRCAHANWH